MKKLDKKTLKKMVWYKIADNKLLLMGGRISESKFKERMRNLVMTYAKIMIPR